MTRFEGEAEAQRTVDASRRALRALARGEKDAPDARAMSFQAETHEHRLAAQRRLRPVVTDEERKWLSVFRAAEAAGRGIAEAGRIANKATGRRQRS